MGAQSERVHRIKVTFGDEAWQTLNQLAAAKGKPIGEVLRDAISLLSWMERERLRGSRFFVARGNTAREIVMA